MICARDRYMVSFRGKRRRKTTREERDERVGEGGEKERERKGKGQRLPMDEYASSRDEKDELKCESAGAEGG